MLWTRHTGAGRKEPGGGSCDSLDPDQILASSDRFSLRLPGAGMMERVLAGSLLHISQGSYVWTNVSSLGHDAELLSGGQSLAAFRR